MIKSIRFFLKFFTQTLKRYGVIIVLSLIAGIAIFFLLNNLIAFVSQRLPRTKRIGVVGKYNLSTLPPEISHLISYGLTEVLSNGQATSSAIVSGWTVKSEGKEFLFFLKPNLFWQDGSRFDPKEISCNISGIKVTISEKGVHLLLESPFAPLPSLLDTPIFKNGRIGLGPYEIKKARIRGGKFSSLMLIPTNRSSKERLLFKFYPTEKDLITAFELGEVDEVGGVSKIEEFSSEKNVTIKAESGPEKKYVALFFNTRKEPFSSKRIRQGLAYAIRKPERKDRATSPISPSSWAYNEKVKTYQFDIDWAKKILEKEGWQPGADFTIRLYVLPELMGWAEKIKTDWEENLGIKSEIYVSSFIPTAEEFDAFLGFGIIPADPDQYPLWHSIQQGNFTGINSPRIDQLLEKGRQTLDLEEREEIYYEFQQVLSEEIPAIFLFYPPSYTVSRQ